MRRITDKTYIDITRSTSVLGLLGIIKMYAAYRSQFLSQTSLVLQKLQTAMSNKHNFILKASYTYSTEQSPS